MRKHFIAVLLFALNGVLFAQTDYFFLVEKPASPGSLIVSVYQTLVVSLVTDIDTVSAAAYGGDSAFLFAAMPGNLPDLAEMAAAGLLPDAVPKEVSGGSFAEALALADEQAAVWGRPEADKKLIIITGAAASGKIHNIPPPPQAFSGIYYLSLDAPPEQGIEGITTPDCIWAVDSENPQPADPQFAPLADGLFNCIKAIVPQYKKINLSEDFTSFSVGSFLLRVRKAVVLAYNNGSGPVELLKTGQAAQGASIYPQSDWTVMQISEGGVYTIENGGAALAAAVQEVSVFVLVAAIAAALIAILSVILVASKFLKERRRRKEILQKRQFNVLYEKDNVEQTGFQPPIYIEKVPDGTGGFSSGATIRTILANMMIPDLERSLLDEVTEIHPFLTCDAVQSPPVWTVHYAPRAESPLPLNIQPFMMPNSNDSQPAWANPAAASSDIGSNSWAQDAKPGDEGGDSKYIEKETVIFGNENLFEIKNIFKKETKCKLFLKKPKS